MSQPSTAIKTGTPDPSPPGRWLFMARVAWIPLTLLILTLNVVMLPRYDAVLQAPCQPGATCFAIQVTQGDRQFLHQFGLSLGFVAGYQVMLDAVSVLVCCALGALIFWRRSADRMALFCAYMLVLFGGAGFTSILQDTLTSISPAWFVLVGTLDLLGQASFQIFFLLFPSGRFMPRWTRWIALLILLYWMYTVFFTPVFNTTSPPWFNALFFAILLCAVGAQVYRYRRVSTLRERQQTRWVVFGFVIGIVGFILLVIIANVLLPPSLRQSGVGQTFGAGTAIYGFLLLIPISIAIAILRSRLYDIDVVINRALVYGSLTGILGALYAGLIIGLESLAGLFGGTAAQNPVVLVISTLAIAALFQPLRRRIQSIIDRRFYRRKYDAEKTLAAFSATLRNEVNLHQLREQLLAVVNETMQPAHISLWLAQPEQHATEQSYRQEPREQASN
ncbi:MAG TPA: hypothetical protein VKT82_22670 [Ktedonobacterales bacterium]|nr:hypothetical protein [Ktedonobacterales bacterium]